MDSIQDQEEHELETTSHCHKLYITSIKLGTLKYESGDSTMHWLCENCWIILGVCDPTR